ncbi:MAG: TetR/AcrR family transcriptional regulator [Caulobacteraceae bacterium]
MEDELTKEALIELTIKLLNDGLDPRQITVRLIAQRAGVGVGLINYHFQTKDNLINLAVQKHINNVIVMTSDKLKEIKGSPKERLAGMAKATLDYLAKYPAISRVSILRDLSSGNTDDNTQHTFKAYQQLVSQVVGEKDAVQKTLVLLFTCQGIFLRAQVIKEECGFDFFDKIQRDKLIDNLVGML